MCDAWLVRKPAVNVPNWVQMVRLYGYITYRLLRLPEGGDAVALVWEAALRDGWVDGVLGRAPPSLRTPACSGFGCVRRGCGARGGRENSGSRGGAAFL